MAGNAIAPAVQARSSVERETVTRKERTQAVIERGDIAELLRLAEGYPCACMGAKDDEPECVCKMNSKQVREAVSLAGLRRGKLIRL